MKHKNEKQNTIFGKVAINEKPPTTRNQNKTNTVKRMNKMHSKIPKNQYYQEEEEY